MCALGLKHKFLVLLKIKDRDSSTALRCCRNGKKIPPQRCAAVGMEYTQPRLQRHPAGACAGRYSAKREQGLPVNPKPFAAKKIYSATLTTRYQQRQTFVIFALYKF